MAIVEGNHSKPHKPRWLVGFLETKKAKTKRKHPKTMATNQQQHKPYENHFGEVFVSKQNGRDAIGPDA